MAWIVREAVRVAWTVWAMSSSVWARLGKRIFVGAWGQGYAFFEHGVEKARIDAVLGGFVGFVKRLRRGVAEKQPEQGADLR